MQNTINIKLIVWILLLPSSILAQDIQNGTFIPDPNYPSGSLPHQINYNNCEVFGAGWIPNWFRSHGTPHRLSSGAIRLFANTGWNPQISEGIVGGYEFKPGITYTVTVIPGGSNRQSGVLHVYASSGITEGVLPIGPSYICGEIAPSFSNIEWIGDMPLPLGSQPGIATFTYTPTVPHQQIYLYPTKFVGSNDLLELDIAQVKIYTCLGGWVEFYDGTSYQIAAGTTAKGNIKTFSWSGITKNIPDQPTRLLGKRIDFRPTTEITPSDRGYLLATAVSDCEGEDGEEPHPDIIWTKLAPPQPDIVELYPNPTQSTLYINVKCEAEEPLTISIKDLSGRMVQSYKITISPPYSHHSIDLSTYESGVFIVELKSTSVSIVKKIVKQG